jgi:hypothetical protein
MDTQKTQNLTSLPLYSEDILISPSLISLKNFTLFNNELFLDSSDDSYENIKYLSYLHSLNLKNTLNFDMNTVSPISYTQVIDNFRADYEDPQWFIDTESNKNKNTFDLNLALSPENEIRVSNPIKLRSTTKNAMVTYSAIQKVFRSRYDEGRSNARLQDLSNSYESHPFLTSPRSPYESMLGKNNESFFTVNNFSKSYFENFNETYFL